MDPLAPLIESLRAEGRLRVWSLVITIFGDSIQMRGGQVSTHRLQALLGRLGVEPGALRTALSRLARDGWVSANRAGRSSTYQLTPKGAADFASATDRIYRRPASDPVQCWSISFGPVANALEIGGMFLCPAAPNQTASDFEIQGRITQLAPNAIEQRLAPTHHNAIAALLGDLDNLERSTFDPLDAAAARTLLIHRWRRMVLRFPEIPAELLPNLLGQTDLRSRVAQAYRQLAPQAEHWWGNPYDKMRPLPPPTQRFFDRFDGI